MESFGDVWVHHISLLPHCGGAHCRNYGIDLPMEAVAKAGKGRMVSAIDGLKASDLATVGLLEEVAVGEKPLIKLTEIETAGSVSVLLRAPTLHSVDEIGRAFDDAIGVISVAMEHGKVLAGGGAPYLHLSKNLREV